MPQWADGRVAKKIGDRELRELLADGLRGSVATVLLANKNPGDAGEGGLLCHGSKGHAQHGRSRKGRNRTVTMCYRRPEGKGLASYFALSATRSAPRNRGPC